MKNPSVIDLFAGVGGLSLGFSQCGFNVVLANEYDKNIANSYIANHPSTQMIVKDIREIDLEQVFLPWKGKVDVIVGGPPCQGFSQKGQRKTIHDSRNFLFKNYIAVVKLVEPTYFVMENVPNLLTAENGFFRKEIEELFRNMGYSLAMNILNASDFGIPQNRRRAVIIGKKGNIPPQYPTPTFEKTTVWDAISDLAYLSSGEGCEMQEYRMKPQTLYQQKLRGSSTMLFNHVATKHSKIALERLALIPPNAGREVLPQKHLTKSIYSGTWTRLRKDEISVTITTRFDTPSSGKFTHPFLDRALTIREAARIQSFPDTFHFIGTKCSQMKQVGNAVPPMLAVAIANCILEDMKY